MCRGSRKHVLDWTEQLGFPQELKALFPLIDVEMSIGAMWMPRGFGAPEEARFEHFGPVWMPSTIWGNLKDWWLIHKKGANTPNWDIAVGCTIENRPGLVLVEAKANWQEMKIDGKALRSDASQNSIENHEQIGRAIDEAQFGWQRVDPRFAITRDSRYQLANRLAFTWKLGMFGLPVILLYLGFTGDEGIRDVGAPFIDDQDWQQALSEYAGDTVPLDLLDRRIDLGPAPVWLVSRSRPVIEISPTGRS
jgi:hypothetical protein